MVCTNNYSTAFCFQISIHVFVNKFRVFDKKRCDQGKEQTDQLRFDEKARKLTMASLERNHILRNIESKKSFR